MTANTEKWAATITPRFHVRPARRCLQTPTATVATHFQHDGAAWMPAESPKGGHSSCLRRTSASLVSALARSSNCAGSKDQTWANSTSSPSGPSGTDSNPASRQHPPLVGMSLASINGGMSRCTTRATRTRPRSRRFSSVIATWPRTSWPFRKCGGARRPLCISLITIHSILPR